MDWLVSDGDSDLGPQGHPVSDSDSDLGPQGHRSSASSSSASSDLGPRGPGALVAPANHGALVALVAPANHDEVALGAPANHDEVALGAPEDFSALQGPEPGIVARLVPFLRPCTASQGVITTALGQVEEREKKDKGAQIDTVMNYVCSDVSRARVSLTVESRIVRIERNKLKKTFGSAMRHRRPFEYLALQQLLRQTGETNYERGF